MSACMFALVAEGMSGPEREIVGVFAYRSIAEAHAKELMAERGHALFFIQALPFDSFADGYMPVSDGAQPQQVPYSVGRKTS